MRIGIDGRLINETGVGRYIRNLTEQLGKIDNENHYIVFLSKKAFDSFIPPNNRWQKRLADVRWHSVREQVIMPILFLREQLDLVHIPYFNVPILYPKTFVVTIHDLTILHFNTGRATTLPWVLYQLRRVGYWLVHAVGLARAAKILTVSNATKQELMDHFHLDSSKIVVTHEGVDDKIKNQKSKIKNEIPIITNPYFLYVGNAYPHKDLETLLRAFQQFNNLTIQQLTKLVLVGKDDFFYKRLKEEVKTLGLASNILFFGEANDAELSNLYTHAIALVFPSRMEGFGLPAIEALALGCPVIVTDIAVFKEILGNFVTYFPVGNVEALASILQKALDGNLARPIAKDIASHLSSFEWPALARATLDTYEDCLGVRSGN